LIIGLQHRKSDGLALPAVRHFHGTRQYATIAVRASCPKRIGYPAGRNSWILWFYEEEGK
jgi:hypothetical protein